VKRDKNRYCESVRSGQFGNISSVRPILYVERLEAVEHFNPHQAVSTMSFEEREKKSSAKHVPEFDLSHRQFLSIKLVVIRTFQPDFINIMSVV
jgi:hypothetical protein